MVIMVDCKLTLCLGVWLPAPKYFFLSQKNAKETDPGHLSNFKFIFCGHIILTKKKFWGTFLFKGAV